MTEIIRVEKSEYDRLKSREEKLMAYYERFVDKNNDLATVEDIVNKNIELEKENKSLRENVNHRAWMCWDLREENEMLETERDEWKLLNDLKAKRIKELEECNLNLQEWLDNKEKVNKSLREEIKSLNKMMLFETELEK